MCVAVRDLDLGLVEGMNLFTNSTVLIDDSARSAVQVMFHHLVVF